MATRLGTASCAAVFILSAALAAAKPPDLPRPEKDQCKEHNPGRLPGDTGPFDPAEEASAREAEATQPIDGFCPGSESLLLRWFVDSIGETVRHLYAPRPKVGKKGVGTAENCEIGADCPLCGKLCGCYAWMGAMIRASWEGVKQGVSASTTARPAAQPHTTMCPYLQRTESGKHSAETADDMPQDVLDNLDKLEQAHLLAQQAERCLRRGRPDLASRRYEEIKALCPGSRYDRLATQQLQSMRGASPSGELAEPIRATRTEHLLNTGPKPKCVEEQVAELLEECQRAYADGRYRKAARLARRALVLDPECVAARALVAKTERLFHLTGRPKTAAPVGIQPSLPPADPTTAEALDRVLRETGEPTAKDAADTEESGVRYRDANGKLVAVPSPEARALKKALRDLIDVLQEGACIDANGGRVQCEVHFGGKMYRVSSDPIGNLRWVVVPIDDGKAAKKR